MKTLRLVVLVLVLSVFAVQTFAAKCQQDEFKAVKELNDGDAPSRRFLLPKIIKTIETYKTIKNNVQSAGNLVKKFILAFIKKLMGFLGIKIDIKTMGSPPQTSPYDNFNPKP